MEGYFFIADLLGFSNMVENLSKEELNLRIDKWKTLVETCAAKYHVTKYQLMSDTIFSATESSVAGLESLINFSRILLSEGTKDSFPIRGAICYGSYEWGKLIYGQAVVDAHKIEVAQNWIGVTCDCKMPNLDAIYGNRTIACYPPPLKQGKIYLAPVVVWEIPNTKELSKHLSGGGLTKKGEILEWSWGEKLTNTIQFRIYLILLDRVKEDNRYFHGILPIEPIELEIVERS